jgi:DNA-binding MarR family transcriptional regulator
MSKIEEQAHIFGSLFILANRLQVLCDKVDENLTLKQWLLLVTIVKNNSQSPTISEVASSIGNSRQNVKKMAVLLEKKGFLTLEKDANDARILRLSLTEKFESYSRQREKKELDFLETLFAGFDNDLVLSLDKGLSLLADNIIKMEQKYE